MKPLPFNFDTWFGGAWHGLARLGLAWQGLARLGTARQGLARQGVVLVLTTGRLV